MRRMLLSTSALCAALLGGCGDADRPADSAPFGTARINSSQGAPVFRTPRVRFRNSTSTNLIVTGEIQVYLGPSLQFTFFVAPSLDRDYVIRDFSRPQMVELRDTAGAAIPLRSARLRFHSFGDTPGSMIALDFELVLTSGGRIEGAASALVDQAYGDPAGQLVQ